MAAAAWPEFIPEPDPIPTSAHPLRPAFLAIRFTRNSPVEHCTYDTLRAAADAARRWSEQDGGAVQVYALVEEVGPSLSVERRVVRGAA